MVVLLNVYICVFRGNSKIYTPGTIAKSQADMAPTKRNKNGAAVKVIILVELGIL